MSDVLDAVRRAIAAALPEGASVEGKLAVRMPASIEEIEIKVEFSDGLRAVVEASAREPHADVVLHADDKWIAWRGSASDFVTDMRAVIPPAKLALLRVMLGESDPYPPQRTRPCGGGTCDDPDCSLKRRYEPRPANVAAFVLKAPALDRLLLVRSGKPGRAWELPGGAREPGEGAWRAVVREVAEESGAEFIHDGLARSVEGCVVFYGTSATHVLAPGDDAVEAQWFDKSEVAALQLSDLPTAVVIRGWGESRA